jgi:hypothetical protein
MFATGLTLERDPLKLGDVLTGLQSWVQDAGGFAAAGLLLWLIYRLVAPGQRGSGYLPWSAPPPGEEPPPSWASALFGLGLLGGVLGYAAAGIVYLPQLIENLSTLFGGEAPKGEEAALSPGAARFGSLSLTVGAACALVTVCVPFLASAAGRLRFRRIWAVARLSAKEAIRGRALYVFSALVLVALFATWFVRSKPENQLNTYVKIAYMAMTPLLLVSAGLLASFSIPNDIKRQTIHTVVTKPVERFEIVLGRFLGYMMLMTAVLFVLTTLSLFYVIRGTNPDAAHETLKARVPVYGDLDFVKTTGEYTDHEQTVSTKPVNVGREWGYHKYIPGESPAKADAGFHYAVWSLNDLPRVLAKRDRARCEFRFDIYRQSKGRENAGVQCSFFFQTRYYKKTPANHKAYLEKRNKLGGGANFDPELDNKLSQEFGYYEVQGKTIADYHTLHVDVPAGLIANALDGPPEGGEASSGENAPLLLVRVRCDTPSQLVGMARYDLYFRADDAGGGSNAWAFALNFYKGAAGIWMRLCLVVGLCVCLSTELGGIISFLCAMLLFAGGIFHEFIAKLAAGGTPGGGSFESAYRLVARKNLLVPLEETTTMNVIKGADEVFRWFIRRVLNIFPDVERFSFTDRVANGFDIGVVGQDLLPTLLLLIAYMLPWVLLGYYLMKSREIAGAH